MLIWGARERGTGDQGHYVITPLLKRGCRKVD